MSFLLQRGTIISVSWCQIYSPDIRRLTSFLNNAMLLNFDLETVVSNCNFMCQTIVLKKNVTRLHMFEFGRIIKHKSYRFLILSDKYYFLNYEWSWHKQYRWSNSFRSKFHTASLSFQVSCIKEQVVDLFCPPPPPPP